MISWALKGVVENDDDYRPSASVAAGSAAIRRAEQRQLISANNTQSSQAVSLTAERALEESRRAAQDVICNSLADHGKAIRQISDIKIEQAQEVLQDVRRQVTKISDQLMQGISEKSVEEQERVLRLIAQANELLFTSAANSLKNFHEKAMDPIAASAQRDHRKLAFDAIDLLKKLEEVVLSERERIQQLKSLEMLHEAQRQHLQDANRSLSNARTNVREAVLNLKMDEETWVGDDQDLALCYFQMAFDKHNERLVFLKSLYPTGLNNSLRDDIIEEQPFMITGEGDSIIVVPGSIRLRS